MFSWGFWNSYWIARSHSKGLYIQMARDRLIVMDRLSCCTKQGRSKQSSRSLWSCSLVLWRLLEGAWVWGFPHLISCLKYILGQSLWDLWFSWLDVLWHQQRQFKTCSAKKHNRNPKFRFGKFCGQRQNGKKHGKHLESWINSILVCYTVWTTWLPVTCRFFGVGWPRKEQLGGISWFSKTTNKEMELVLVIDPHICARLWSQIWICK